jgi:hypothetical protein
VNVDKVRPQRRGRGFTGDHLPPFGDDLTQHRPEAQRQFSLFIGNLRLLADLQQRLSRLETRRSS